MDKQTCRAITAAAVKALEAVAAEYGVVVEAKGGTYFDSSALIKFEFSDVNESGVAQTREATDFTAYAQHYGLNPEDLGKQFVSGTTRYTIIGLKRRATKMPILAKRLDGKVYKFSAAGVVSGLGLIKQVESA